MDEKILTRIRAVLTKAERASTPEEGESYFAMAAKLIAKYGVDEALLSFASPTKSEVNSRYFTCPNPYSMDKVSLLAAIARSLGCQIVLINKDRELPSNQDRVCRVFGFESDLDRVALLYTSLLVQAASALLYAEIVDKPANENTKSFKVSWSAGFTHAVQNRLEAAEAEAVSNAAAATPGTSVELVMIDRSNEVATAFKAAYPKLATVSRSFAGTGWGHGVKAGNKANIGSKVVTQ